MHKVSGYHKILQINNPKKRHGIVIYSVVSVSFFTGQKQAGKQASR